MQTRIHTYTSAHACIYTHIHRALESQIIYMLIELTLTCAKMECYILE